VPDPPVPPGGEPVGDDDLPWRPWSPAEVARRLSGVTATWCVAGGWAVDLHLGRVTREHKDLEIAVPAAEFAQVRDALDDVEFDVVGAGRRSRRDPGLRRPYRDVVRHTDDGVPYLAPEIVLLFKAKARRPKDEADLASLIPVLDGAQRDWLARSLTVVHPGHPRIAAVAGRGA
jgi:hypothetical protein